MDINKDTVVELQKALKPVLDKLGQGGEFVYSTYYKQQIVSVITDVIWILFLIVLSFIGLKMWNSAKKIREDDRDMSDVLQILSIFTWVIALIFIPLLLSHGIQRVINPEYFIIQDLLSVVKKP